MLSFKRFLLETDNLQFLKEEIEKSDPKGKLHEILVAKHLSSDKDEEKTLPTHYRDEKTNKTPQQTHDHIVKEYMGDSGINHPDYIEADRRAKEAAEHIKNHLGKKGYDFNRLSRVAWTSNDSDHEKFTGHADPNSDADVMLHFNAHENELKTNPKHQGHHVGVSLKVGANNPNLRNPGIESLNKLAKGNSSVTDSILDDHDNKMEELGYDRTKSKKANHHQFKKDIGRSGKNELAYDAPDAEAGKQASGHTDKTIKALADHYRDSINKLSKQDGQHLLKTLVAPDTMYPHIRAHTKTPGRGQKTTTHHVEDHQQNFDKHFADNNYHGFVAVSGGGKGHSIHIHEKKPDGKVGKKLASLNMKTGSNSPFSGFVSTVQSHI